MLIYIAKNGTQTGPYSEEQIHGMLNGGLVTADDFAWRDGAHDWQPLQTLLGLAQPPPIPTTRPSHSPQTHEGLTQPAQPSGIGGWLLFFCVGLTILNPLMSILRIVTAWESSKHAFDTFPSIKGALICEDIGSTALDIYGLVVGCMIWSGATRGREFAKLFLLINLSGYVGVEVMTFLMMSDLPPQNIASGVTASFGSVFKAFINFLVWWFYFKRSKRVRNTYGDARA